MRIRPYLLAVLLCVIALGSTTWSYDRPANMRETSIVSTTSNTTGGSLDDHPWGEDQSIGQPLTDPNVDRPRASAIAKANLLLFRAQMYFINMLSRWSFTTANIVTQPGTTTGDVPTNTTTTVSAGVANAN